MFNISKYAKLIIFILILLAVYVASTTSRLMQITKGWNTYPEQYYVDNIPMVTTLDAYKWIRIGEEFRKGEYIASEKDSLMYFPDGWQRDTPVPLLPVMLAKLSYFFDGNLYEAGLRLIPFLAGLFIFPFCIYFYRLGYPAAGILGAFCGTFASTYYGRTLAGRTKTDCLTLFFLFLTALFIMIASEKKKNKEVWAFSAAAGLTQLFFTWWYFHPAFILVFGGVLVLTLIICGHKTKNIAVAAGVYIIFSNPLFIKDSLLNLYSILNSYLFSPVSFSDGFPNVYQTVSEAKVPIGQILEGVFIHPVFVFFALGAFIVMAVRSPKRVFPLLPILVIGLLIFKSSGRFVIFLVPFLGAGIGYLLNYAVTKIPSTLISREWVKALVAYGAVGLFILVIAIMPTPQGFIMSFNQQGKKLPFYATPPPSIPTNMYRTFNLLRETLPQGSAVYTWWDYGLAIEAQAGLATFHDGMCQNTSKTWLIARSMLAPPEETVRYISYITNNGTGAIEEKRRKRRITAAEVLKDVENYDEPLKNDKIYISFTDDMIWKYGAIKEIGDWDIINSSQGARGGMLDIRQCTADNGRVISCGGLNIDAMLGVMNSSVPLKKIDYVEGGYLVKEQETDFASSLYAVLLQSAGKSYALLIMNEKEYRSAFVQLYLLGVYDPAFYEEVINIYPLVRVFHVKSRHTAQ
ncbi:MAG: dolichyl-diphosphooligosaccharide--protein glycosyltransferase subunit STT3 [Deferribacteraceae bacterium]|jgi:dolichyl-diphosphooligosaccharide--protein glycosyltransferase|nr:dolichyl-diphosphooligosaccharide--protein glycosyltransferase subunit STT3 [Deferribacteraceae bacterium]